MEAAEKLRSNPELQDTGDRVSLILDAKADSSTCLYYLLSHQAQRVFWLTEDTKEPARLKLHCTAKDCQHAWDPKHCISAQYCYLEGDNKNHGHHSAWVIGGVKLALPYPDKLTHSLVEGVLRSSYGQSDDYFDIDYSETTPVKPYRRTWLMCLLGPFLLGSADAWAEELYTFHENFSPDGWSRFVGKVDMTIRDSNLLATVLLSTSVSVLTIGSVDDSTANGTRSTVQIIIYASIIYSVGSIAVGLAIFQQYRAKGIDAPLRAVTVLKRILKEPYGLERLAIGCCLPHVLLVWSLIMFLGAFSIVFYKGTDRKVQVP
ncbi:hypothetical protein ID866_4277, partial [Astraeus odoratus]